MSKCPKCGIQWEPPCDQTACIVLFGECISCRRFELTEDEIKQIQASVALERKAENARELGLDYYVPCCTDQTCPKCKAALSGEAQTRSVVKDEPVACVIDGDLYFHHEIDWEDLAYQGHGIELLYTTPPQRKPLADEEIWACLPKDPDEMAFARAIEAAHGIKGEA